MTPPMPPLPGDGTPHPNPPRLCPPCAAESARWYDYRPAQPVRIANHGSGDDTLARRADVRKARFESWRDTVRYQQDLIRRQCAEQHGAAPLRVGSLFTGYGGLDMAVRAVLGGELAWVSDIDAGACAVLAHHHPEVPNVGDVSAVDWGTVGPVDVLAAGFPCQDISNAGRRAGIRGARSGLWSHVVDAIGVVRPRLVVLENVAALVVRGLDRVLADLAALGFDAEWTTLRASDVGAPHRRERWFAVAWPAADTDRVGREWPGTARNGGTGSAHGGEPAADADGERQQQLQGRVTHVPGRFDDRPAEGVEWGDYAPAIHRWAATLGRPAPEPTIVSAKGARVLNPSFTSWMQGLPDGYLTQVPGLSRGALIKLCGNGVVPQQGGAALADLLARPSAAAAAA